jgi:hypothetical protein
MKISKNLSPLTELMSFESNDKTFRLTVYKKRNMHRVVITDLAYGVKKRKVHQSVNLDESMNFFHKAIKVYSDRIKKS